MKIAEGTFAGLHATEVDLFRKVLKGVKGVGIEIGCCDGYSSAVILDASELHLTSIDPFIPDSMEASLVGRKERYFENVAPYKRWGLVEKYSWQEVSEWRRLMGDSDSLDFLFIDGDHTYTAVLQDFTDWTPLLKTGGILAIHDARMGREGGAGHHPGPSRVAQERIFNDPANWEVIGEAFSLVIARKIH